MSNDAALLALVAKLAQQADREHALNIDRPAAAWCPAVIEAAGLITELRVYQNAGDELPWSKYAAVRAFADGWNRLVAIYKNKTINDLQQSEVAA